MDTAAAAKSLADALAPFSGKINIGNDVDWSLAGANERGDAAFEQKTLTSVEQLLAYFDSAAGAVGKKNMLDHTPDALHDWFMAGKGILPSQPTIESCSQGHWGTTEDGKVVQFNKEICHSPGDVWWVPVGPDGTVYWAAATRAACSNPHMSVVIYPRGHAPAGPQPGPTRDARRPAQGVGRRAGRSAPRTGSQPIGSHGRRPPRALTGLSTRPRGGCCLGRKRRRWHPIGATAADRTRGPEFRGPISRWRRRASHA